MIGIMIILVLGVACFGVAYSLKFYLTCNVFIVRLCKLV